MALVPGQLNLDGTVWRAVRIFLQLMMSSPAANISLLSTGIAEFGPKVRQAWFSWAFFVGIPHMSPGCILIEVNQDPVDWNPGTI